MPSIEAPNHFKLKQLESGSSLVAKQSGVVTAVVQVRSLAWAFLHAMDAAKKKKKERKEKIKRNSWDLNSPGQDREPRSLTAVLYSLSASDFRKECCLWGCKSSLLPSSPHPYSLATLLEVKPFCILMSFGPFHTEAYEYVSSRVSGGLCDCGPTP